MSVNSVGGNSAKAVAAIPYTPPTRQVSSSSNGSQSPTLIDGLLDQLTDLLTDSVKNKNSAPANILLELLAAGENGPLPAGAESLPKELLALLDLVTGQAELTGRGEEFKALLREYVAVRWALCELEEIIKAEQSGVVDEDTHYHFEQLAAAKAFLKQLESTVARRLDKLESEAGYTNWLQIYRDDLESREEGGDEDPAVSVTLPRDADAAKIVALLLEAAPRLPLDKLPAPNAPVAHAAEAAPAGDANPYH